MHIKQRILGVIAFIFIRLYSKTFRYIIHPSSESLTSNCLYAFWHQYELCLLPYFAYQNIGVLVSNSKDGTIMTTVLQMLGYKIVRGSNHRNAISGFLKALKMVKEGSYFALAVDGPKGPIYKVKEGIIKLSEKSGTQILPLGVRAENYFEFKKAWNKARLPKPFSKVHIYLGNPNQYNQESLEIELKKINY